MIDFLSQLVQNTIAFIPGFSSNGSVTNEPAEMDITIENLDLLSNITKDINITSVSELCEQYTNHTNLSSMTYDACTKFFNLEEEQDYLPSTQNILISSLTGLAIIGTTVLIKQCKEAKDSWEKSLEAMRMPSLAERDNENQFPELDLEDTNQFNCPLSQAAMEQPCWVITGNKSQYVHAFDASYVEHMLKFATTQEIQQIQHTLEQYDDDARQTYKKDIQRHRLRLAILQSENGWKTVSCENPVNRQKFTWQDVHQAPQMCTLMKKYIEGDISQDKLASEIATITDNKRATVERSKYCFWL